LQDYALQVPVNSGHNGDVDLDSVPPLASINDIKGHDISVDISPTNEVESPSGRTIAPLPTGGANPNESDCIAKIKTNGTSTVDLTGGARFCVQTNEGRIAFLQTISVPSGSGTAQFKVTVWELPG
jgi:hypothetical protein